MFVAGDLEGGEPGSGSPRGPGGGTSGTRGGSRGDLYSSYIKTGGAEADPITAREDIPNIKWVSLQDGTRESGDELEDRAAIFERGSNLLKINADFRVFNDLMKRCSADYNPASDNNVETEVRDVVREWIGLQLTEVVVSISAMEGSREWGSDVVARVLSPEALTAATMPRYVMLKTINRALGARFSKKGSSEEA